MGALGTSLGVFLLTVGVLRLVRASRAKTPSSPEETVGESFRGPPVSVLLWVLVCALGAALILFEFLK